jgi:hypothetical protein
VVSNNPATRQRGSITVAIAACVLLGFSSELSGQGLPAHLARLVFSSRLLAFLLAA